MAATKITLISGNEQRPRVKSTLTNPFVVMLSDDSNLPSAGENVVFDIVTIPDGTQGQSLTGAVQSATIATDANGKASIGMTIGDTEGQYLITATKAGLVGSPVEFELTAVSAAAIISLDKINRYLKHDVGHDEMRDDFLQDCIDIVSEQIERFIQGPIVARNFEDELYDGPDDQFMRLRNWPVIGLVDNDPDNLEYRATPTDDWRTLEDEIKYILVKPERPWGIYLFAQYFIEGDQNIRISYRAGYERIPKDIERVCLEAVAEMYKESTRSGEARLGRRSIAHSAGGGSTTDTFYELSDRHQKLLRMYRHQNV